MEKRISDFVKLKERLVEVYHDFMRQEQTVKLHNDLPFLTQKVSREKAIADLHSIIEEMDLLETRLNEALKTLSKDELSEIIRADLRTCIDNETAKPLSWVCGWIGGFDPIDPPMGTPLINSSIGVEYSPGVWIEIGSEDRCYGFRNLLFSVSADGLSGYDYFDLPNMEESFLSILARAGRYVAEKEELGEDEDLDEL